MIFLIFILLFSFGLIKAISSIIGEQKRSKRAWERLEEYEKKDEKRLKNNTKKEKN
mgnify:FL=1|tara:strand:+ start:98673 stop:98840 length:168 start_codon:yes stop_codon:yes gene_type:complete